MTPAAAVVASISRRVGDNFADMTSSCVFSDPIGCTQMKGHIRQSYCAVVWFDDTFV
jgi:hypothetical protein